MQAGKASRCSGRFSQGTFPPRGLNSGWTEATSAGTPLAGFQRPPLLVLHPRRQHQQPAPPPPPPPAPTPCTCATPARVASKLPPQTPDHVPRQPPGSHSIRETFVLGPLRLRCWIANLAHIHTPLTFAHNDHQLEQPFPIESTSTTTTALGLDSLALSPSRPHSLPSTSTSWRRGPRRVSLTGHQHHGRSQHLAASNVCLAQQPTGTYVAPIPA